MFKYPTFGVFSKYLKETMNGILNGGKGLQWEIQFKAALLGNKGECIILVIFICHDSNVFH